MADIVFVAIVIAFFAGATGRAAPPAVEVAPAKAA